MDGGTVKGKNAENEGFGIQEISKETKEFPTFPSFQVVVQLEQVFNSPTFGKSPNEIVLPQTQRNWKYLFLYKNTFLFFNCKINVIQWCSYQCILMIFNCQLFKF